MSMSQASANLSVVHVTIESSNHEQRIDNYLITRLKGLPKSRVYRLLRKGEVRVNKKRVKPDYKLQIDDIVRIPPIRLENTENKLPNANLGQIKGLETNILFEDDALIVLNKPAGLAVHGGSGLSFGAIEALRALRPDARYLELVHRLDRDTSGCLMIAKKRSMLRALHQQLQSKTLNKQYHALVHGHWSKSKQKIEAPLLKQHLPSGERVVSVHREGKSALTRFRVLEKFAQYTLVEASPITGRTHQIRVHCLHGGCAIAGDPKYSQQEQRQAASDVGLQRLFLHAERITFTQLNGESRQVIAPYDSALRSVVTKLSRREERS